MADDANAKRELEQELERSNRELEELARALSHDLRAPLRAITTFGELLANEHQEGLGAEATEYLGYVTDGAHRMRDMVNGLIRFARLDGRRESPREIDLNAVLDEVEVALAAALHERDAELSREGEFGAIAGVHIQLVQLFHQLVQNSLKFSHATPHITIRGSLGDDEVVVEVVDDGIGFPSHAAERIFNLFERAVTRDQFDGVGVGLAICRKIVDRHGGSIKAHGEPGHGARFVMRWPASCLPRG